MPIKPTDPVYPNMHPGNVSQEGMDIRTYLNGHILAGLVSNREVWSAVEKASELQNIPLETGFVTIAFGLTDTLINCLNKQK